MRKQNIAVCFMMTLGHLSKGTTTSATVSYVEALTEGLHRTKTAIFFS